MEKSNFIEIINSRHSVRQFLNKPVHKKHLDQILNAARLAPSGGNLQGWRFIVMQQRELLAEIESTIQKKIAKLPEMMEDCIKDSEYFANVLAKRLRFSSLFFVSAPVTIAVLYKHNPYNKPYLDFLMQKGMDRHEAYQRMGYVEIQSAAAATENIILAAHALGYGSCWMNVPFIAIEEIKAVLDISPPWEISAFVPIGYPDPNGPAPVINKKSLEKIVTYR
jgi:nitroreductase